MFVLVCLIIAAVLAFLAGFNVPSSRFSLGWFAVGFIAVAMLGGSAYFQ